MTALVRITNRDELRAWLQGKPTPWAQAIAVRAALRVMPYIGPSIDVQSLTGEQQQRLIVAVARANFVSTAILLHRNGDSIVFADDAASASEAAFANAATAANATANTAANAAFAAADAANAAANAAFAADDDTADAVTNAAFADDGEADNAIWFSVSADATWLDATETVPVGQRGSALLLRPLWSQNTPKRIANAWNRFAHSPFAAEHGFHPWVRWYGALTALDGKGIPRLLFSDSLTLRIATQPDEWWKRPALEINTDIARWLAEEQTAPSPPPANDLSSQLTEALDALPGQQPAPYQFDWRDGHMEVLPPDALPEDGGLTQDYLDEAREKADDLLQHLTGSNVNPEIARKVGKLREVLTERAADLRPAVVDSRTITVERLVQRLDNPEDKAELSSRILSDLDDIAETARRLCQCLPQLWRRDVEALARTLTTDSAASLLSNLNTLRDGIKDAEILNPDVQAAFEELSEESAEEADEELNKRRTAMFGATVRNFLNALLHAWKWTSAKAEDVKRYFANGAQFLADELIRFMKGVGKNIRSEAEKLMAKAIVICGISLAATGILLVSNYGPIREIVRFFPELERIASVLDMIRSGTVPPPSAPPPVPPAAPPRAARPQSDKSPTRPA